LASGRLGCPPEIVCPAVAKHLVQIDPENPNEPMLNAAVMDELALLSGPLYTVSALGKMDTGKSTVLTFLLRALLPPQYLRECPAGFGIRDITTA
jgi:hypothetical protein